MANENDQTNQAAPSGDEAANDSVSVITLTDEQMQDITAQGLTTRLPYNFTDGRSESEQLLAAWGVDASPEAVQSRVGRMWAERDRMEADLWDRMNGEMFRHIPGAVNDDRDYGPTIAQEYRVAQQDALADGNNDLQQLRVPTLIANARVDDGVMWQINPLALARDGFDVRRVGQLFSMTQIGEPLPPEAPDPFEAANIAVSAVTVPDGTTVAPLEPPREQQVASTDPIIR